MPWLVLAAFGLGVAILVAVQAPRPRELLYFVAMLVSVAIGVAIPHPKDAVFVIALCLVLALATLVGSSARLVWRQKRRYSPPRRGHR
jgi:hypothetical protein